MERELPEQKPRSSASTDARVRRTRAALRHSLLELLQTRPLDQISPGEVAAAAGVGYATYYRHYPSKDALLEDLAAEEIGRLFDLALPLFDTSDSPQACQAVCIYLDQRRSLWRALLTGGAAGTVREEFLRRAREAAVNRPERQGRLPVDLALVLAVTVTIQVLDWWLRQAEPWPAARVADIISQFNNVFDSASGSEGAGASAPRPR